MHDRKTNDMGEDRPWWSPFAWPRWARIIFAMTLPVSGPIWVVAWFAGMLTFMALVVCVAAPLGGLWCLFEMAFSRDRPVKAKPQ